jgi:uncharacterized protein YqjF (DUF2071 family)
MTARDGPGAGDPRSRSDVRRAHVWQTEADQLFLSWPVAAGALVGRVPPPLVLDTFDGRPWITLISFRVERLRPRWLPPVPGLSRFGEVDCLTQVRLGDERGVWFFRIDAATRLGSALGRRLFALPYHRAAVRMDHAGEWHTVRSEGPGELHAHYRPVGPEHEAAPGTLAHFVVERLAMFSRTRRGTLLRGVQTRAPRRIRDCGVALERNALPEATGLPGPDGEVAAWWCRQAVVGTVLPAPLGRSIPAVSARADR